MSYVNAAIYGIVQGITEFLPISSSGHLLILHKFLKLPVTSEIAFDVILHAATLVAVIFYFRKKVLSISISWFKSLSGNSNEDSRIGWFLIIATVPAGLAGFFLEDLLENKLRSIYVVIIMLIIVGVLFIIMEKFSRKTGDYKDLNWKNVLFIGMAQAIALIPGTSRSGITTIAGLGVGLKREAAIRFSFLLSIPIIVGASIKKIPPVFSGGLAGNEIDLIIISFIFSLASGFLAIKFLIKYSRSHSLNIFAYYRFALAFLLLVVILYGK